jgi:hypothetical protein
MDAIDLGFAHNTSANVLYIQERKSLMMLNQANIDKQHELLFWKEKMVTQLAQIFFSNQLRISSVSSTISFKLETIARFIMTKSVQYLFFESTGRKPHLFRH